MTLGWTETLAMLGSGGVFLLTVQYFARYWDKLKNKFRSRGIKLDYQLELLSALIVMGLLFVFLSPVMGWMIHNIPALFGVLVVLCYPICMMILRPVTFQKVLNIDSDFRIYRIFVIFSAFAGGYFTIYGFSSINFNQPLFFSLIMIFIGVIGQTVPLLPDYIEKVTRFNLGMNSEVMDSGESRNALIFLGGLSVVTFLILRFVTGSIM